MQPWLVLAAAAAVAAAGATGATSATSARDCALKDLAYEFGTSRGAAVDGQALWDGLFQAAGCKGAPPRPTAPPPHPPLPAVPPAPLNFYVSASAGNDSHAGTSVGTPFLTLLRARDAVRAAACRRSSPPCAAVVFVAAGLTYDLNETLRLDERDSRVTWVAGPGPAGARAKVTGSLRIQASDLKWQPWRGNAFKADLSAVLPPAVKAALRSRSRRNRRRRATRAEQGGWDYGDDPALINQLFVDDSRAILARWPNGDPEEVSGLCLQAAAPHWGVVAGGCKAWVTPDGGVVAQQPPGTPRTQKLNNFPTCEMAHCVNRGESPTFGCTECKTCGTFGPYFVNDPPAGHPLYDGRTDVQYGWGNSSLQQFWSDVFARPGGVTSAAAANRTGGWSNPSDGTVHMFHGALWGWWAFNIASIAQHTHEINFGFGGHQEARGWSVTSKSNFYVEGILEELDSDREWFFEPDTFTLYRYGSYNSSGDGRWSEPKGEVSLPLLTTLVSIASNRTAMVDDPTFADRVHSVRWIGFEFTQTRTTFMSVPYEVPSAGDWSVARVGSVVVENAANISISHCKFFQTGGNAVLFSASVTDSSVTDTLFERVGDSAVVLLGVAQMDVGVAPTYPNRNVISRNHVHNYGVYGKQTSAFFQALSANSTVANNVFHGGPRAHVNLNDGFAGNNTVEGNLLFASVRETADHGPVNTWNRMPYWTINGVDDGFGPWPNISKPHPHASAVKQWDFIRRNLVFTDYGGSRALDHDDGSQFFRDEENVLVSSGVKNFLGNTKHFVGNLIVGAGEKGICCYQSDGAASIGHANHVFANNTCLYTVDTGGCGAANESGPYMSHCPPATLRPSDDSFGAWVRNSSFATMGNSYHSAQPYRLRCPPWPSLAQTQAATGEELGSSAGPPLGVEVMVKLARRLLRMPDHPMA